MGPSTLRDLDRDLDIILALQVHVAKNCVLGICMGTSRCRKPCGLRVYGGSGFPVTASEYSLSIRVVVLKIVGPFFVIDYFEEPTM